MSLSQHGLKLTGNADIDQEILHFVKKWNLPQFNDEFAEIVASLYRLSQQDLTTGDLHLFRRSLGELRYAQKVFAPYRHVKKICIFGSARTPESSPNYQKALRFAELMKKSDFMTITGAGPGIMEAAQRGATAEGSFGLNIRLPFEQEANPTIAHDPKLVTFRYFFTRKLTFLREAAAIAVFPGGFGTMDEAFEALTLLQTGKARLIPVVLIDTPKGDFWSSFIAYLREHLLKNKLVSPQDFHLFKVTSDLEEAREEILRFYRNFHSYRFVGSHLVIRLQRAISAKALELLREDFADLLGPAGEIKPSEALPQEKNEPELFNLPRLIITFQHLDFGRLRQLIDRLNR